MVYLLVVQGARWKGLEDPNSIPHERNLASSQ